MTRRKVSGVDDVYRDRVSGRYYVRIQAHESAMTPGGPTPYVDDFFPAGLELYEAIALRERIHADIEQGRFYAEAYQPVRTPTLAALAEDLATAKEGARRSNDTVREFRHYVTKWRGTLGDTRVDVVNYQHVRRWWDDVQTKETPFVCNKALMTLRSVIEHGRRTGFRSDENPTRALLKAKVPPPRPKATLDVEAFTNILAHVRKIDARRVVEGNAFRPYMGHAPYLLTMATLAARGAEVANLQWADIDREGGTVTLWDTKTAPSLIRPLTDELLNELDAHWEQMNAGPAKAMAASDYIFPRVDGSKAQSDRVRAVWTEALECAGYPVGRGNQGWTPHDVRRMGIFLLYESGGQERDVMQYVGHHVASVHAMYIQRNHKRLQGIASRASHKLFQSAPAPLLGTPPATEEDDM